MAGIASDIRGAWRSLSRAPSFAAVAVLCMAAGVGVAATMLAVTNAYLVRSLPFANAHRLHHVVYAPPGQPEPRGLSALDWAALGDVVEVADGSTRMRFYLTDGAYAQEAQGLSVAPGSQEMLGVRVEAGRPFVDEDFAAGAENVALISDALWRTRFGAAADAVGGVLRASLNDQADAGLAFRIVGVLPADFRYAADMARDIEIVIPLRVPPRVYLVRLAEGVPPSVAERRITEAARGVAAVPADWSVRLESVRDRYVAGLRPLLLAVTAAGALMLVIVYLNVAVLMLLRAARRRRDVATRVALGAPRGAVLRAVAAESVLISTAAVTLGLALGAGALRLLEPAIEQHLGRPAPGAAAAIELTSMVVLAVVGIGLLAAALLAIVPAAASWPRKLAETLRRDSRSATDSRRVRRVQSALIAFEIAGSLALLVACGLMVRSAVNLLGADLGFRIDGVVRARLALPQRTYPDAEALARFHERFVDRIAAETGAPIALANWPPFYAPPRQSLQLDRADAPAYEAAVIAVTAEFFSILDVPVTQGRAFTRDDQLGAEPVALVSESLARELWPGASAVGQRIRTGEQPAARSPLGPSRTVVGVVRDVRQDHSDTDSRDIYLPFAQTPNQYAPLFIRTDRPAAAWLPTLRAAAHELDPAALITGVTELRAEGDRLLAPARFLALILSAFAVFAAFVAVIGIYAVTAYAVHQRQRESAIRIAVGASDAALIRMFMKDGGVVVAAGLALGLLSALGAARRVAAQLYGVSPLDPATLAAACLALGSAALLAIWFAARGATAENPSEALTEN